MSLVTVNDMTPLQKKTLETRQLLGQQAPFWPWKLPLGLVYIDYCTQSFDTNSFSHSFHKHINTQHQ